MGHVLPVASGGRVFESPSPVAITAAAVPPLRVKKKAFHSVRAFYSCRWLLTTYCLESLQGPQTMIRIARLISSDSHSLSDDAPARQRAMFSIQRSSIVVMQRTAILKHKQKGTST